MKTAAMALAPTLLLPALLLAACADQAKPVATVPPPAPAPAIVAAPPPASPERLVVVFSYGSADLSQDGQKSLDQGARLYRDGHPAVMIVAGHADPSGDELGNLLLSGRRAYAVKSGLVARGLPPDKLELQAFGASPPLVTPDPGSAENRSAVVTWR